LSKISGVRKAIYKAIGTAERGSKSANVVPFPKAAVKRKRRVVKPKTYKSIKPTGQKEEHPFWGGDDRFKKVTINGKTYMQREDGAMFTLKKNGSWVLTKVRGGRAKSSFGRKALPYAATAAAGGAAAGYIAGRKK